VLDALRIRTTLFAMADLPPGWGVAFPSRAGAYFHVLDGDDGWLQVEGQPPQRVTSGDTVLLAGGDSHRLTRERGADALVLFDPLTWESNAVTSGDGKSSGVTLVCGAIDVAESRHVVLGLLPTLVHVGRDDSGAGDLELTLRLLRRETREHGAGSATLLARLGDVLLVQLVRIWADREGIEHSGWIGALRDPHIGPALTALHADPASAWTLETLATVAHLSRSRFAQRFTELVGQSPGAYLTQWRLATAHRLLLEGHTIRETSKAVGYASEPAFSRAFSRQHGVAPSRVAVAAR
jgi:AraC-like DNA-binding protein